MQKDTWSKNYTLQGLTIGHIEISEMVATKKIFEILKIKKESETDFKCSYDNGGLYCENLLPVNDLVCTCIACFVR